MSTQSWSRTNSASGTGKMIILREQAVRAREKAVSVREVVVAERERALDKGMEDVSVEGT